MSKTEFINYAIGRIEKKKQKEIQRKRRLDSDFVGHIMDTAMKSRKRSGLSVLFRKKH